MKLTTLIALAIASPQLLAATGDKFNCEMIKEKPVRAACIADRTAKATPAPAVVQQPSAPPLDEKATFIAEAKRRVAERLTDPSSAQFSHTLYNHNKALNARFFCGEMNAKNQYGGYVGFKMFYAMQRLEPGAGSWVTYIAGTETADEELPKAKGASGCTAPGVELVK